jgi:hypothetical protein
MIAICQSCSAEFKTYPCWVKRNGGKFCSYKCMGIAKLGVTPYVRTPEQNKRMSEIMRSKDSSLNRERFLKINGSRKGKTFVDIYGDRADEVRAKYGKNGSENPNWKGGKHRNKYPWIFFKMRQGIIDRDGNKCMNCDMTGEEHKAKYTNRGLTVHHIDYDKENNNSMNLITLCIWCNCKANGKRQQWQSHYSALLGR